MSERMISRIAPTPSGFLHLGNLYNFVLTRNAVREANGTLWLRIDDCDATRMRMEYLDDLFETLEWLGIRWDQGPRSVQEFLSRDSQSLRKAEYFSKLDQIPHYACDCSRQQIKARTPLAYDGHCDGRNLPFEAGKTAIRARLPHSPHPVIWTKDDLPAYHWVSLWDDLRLGTTHIVRGEDLRESTRIQIELAAESSDETAQKNYLTIRYAFHPLVTGPDGAKLSKSVLAQSLPASDSNILASLRHDRRLGRSPDEIFSCLPPLPPLQWESSFSFLE